jgi:hypothetical protein
MQRKITQATVRQAIDSYIATNPDRLKQTTISEIKHANAVTACNKIGLQLDEKEKYAASKPWFEKAVALGNFCSMWNLAIILNGENDDGVTLDLEQAVELFHRSWPRWTDGIIWGKQTVSKSESQNKVVTKLVEMTGPKFLDKSKRKNAKAKIATANLSAQIALSDIYFQRFLQNGNLSDIAEMKKPLDTVLDHAFKVSPKKTGSKPREKKETEITSSYSLEKQARTGMLLELHQFVANEFPDLKEESKALFSDPYKLGMKYKSMAERFHDRSKPLSKEYAAHFYVAAGNAFARIDLNLYSVHASEMYVAAHSLRSEMHLDTFMPAQAMTSLSTKILEKKDESAVALYVKHLINCLAKDTYNDEILSAELFTSTLTQIVESRLLFKTPKVASDFINNMMDAIIYNFQKAHPDIQIAMSTLVAKLTAQVENLPDAATVVILHQRLADFHGLSPDNVSQIEHRRLALEVAEQKELKDLATVRKQYVDSLLTVGDTYARKLSVDAKNCDQAEKLFTTAIKLGAVQGHVGMAFVKQKSGAPKDKETAAQHLCEAVSSIVKAEATTVVSTTLFLQTSLAPLERKRDSSPKAQNTKIDLTLALNIWYQILLFLPQLDPRDPARLQVEKAASEFLKLLLTSRAFNRQLLDAFYKYVQLTKDHAHALLITEMPGLTLDEKYNLLTLIPRHIDFDEKINSRKKELHALNKTKIKISGLTEILQRAREEKIDADNQAYLDAIHEWIAMHGKVEVFSKLSLHQQIEHLSQFALELHEHQHPLAVIAKNALLAEWEKSNSMLGAFLICKFNKQEELALKHFKKFDTETLPKQQVQQLGKVLLKLHDASTAELKTLGAELGSDYRKTLLSRLQPEKLYARCNVVLSANICRREQVLAEIEAKKLSSITASAKKDEVLALDFLLKDISTKLSTVSVGSDEYLALTQRSLCLSVKLAMLTCNVEAAEEEFQLPQDRLRMMYGEAMKSLSQCANSRSKDIGPLRDFADQCFNLLVFDEKIRAIVKTFEFKIDAIITAKLSSLIKYKDTFEFFQAGIKPVYTADVDPAQIAKIQIALGLKQAPDLERKRSEQTVMPGTLGFHAQPLTGVVAGATAENTQDDSNTKLQIFVVQAG